MLFCHCFICWNFSCFDSRWWWITAIIKFDLCKNLPNYPFRVIVFLYKNLTFSKYLSSVSNNSVVEQIIYARWVSVFKVPCFQLWGANEFKLRYTSALVTFRETVVTIFSSSLHSITSKKPNLKLHSLLYVNWILEWKLFSTDKIWSTVPVFTKVMVSSTYRFQKLSSAVSTATLY